MASSGVSGSANNTTSSTNSGRVVISGMASGLDTTGVISALTGAENNQIRNAQSREGGLKDKLNAWQQFNTLLTSLQAATNDLSSHASYKEMAAVSSNPQVATVTAAAGAAAGNHTLTVTSLAQNHQVLSDNQQGASTPLNLAGKFLVNGKQINVTSGDTLNDVASAVNNANAGVTAKILAISSGNVQLSLSANESGTANGISATDLGDGTVLQKLGIVSASKAPAVREAGKTPRGAHTASSIVLPNAGAKLSTLIGGPNSAPLTGTVQINGAKVLIDTGSMSLSDVANAINASAAGVTAQVVGVPDSSGAVTPQSKKQLQISSTKGDISFTDDNTVLASLGVVQSAFKNQATAAQDAAFTVDSIAYTRPANMVADVIPDVTMTLLSTGTAATATAPASPGTSNISITGKTDAVVADIQSLIAAYQKVNDFVNAQNTFTGNKPAKGTEQSSPPLFGDYGLISVQQQLGRVLTNSVSGKTLSSIGVAMNANNQLTVDTQKLTTALQTDPQSVYTLFGVTGKPSDSNVTFVSATTETRDSAGVGYAVKITQAATAARVAASVAQTAPTKTAEVLTFGGKVFSGAEQMLTIPAGSSQQDIIDLINNDSTLSQFVYAAKDDDTGKLQITAKSYGSSNGFSVSSDQQASETSTGIGTDQIGASGQDVRGSIGDEPATGIGQTLSGNMNNRRTAGLVLTVTATQPGNYGTINVSHGIADTLHRLVDQTTQGKTSQIGAAEDAINNQIADIDKQVDEMETQLQKYTDQLTSQFNDMESRVNTLHSQGKALNAELASNAGYTGGQNSNNKNNL